MAILLGGIGLALVFSDPTQGESVTTRILLTALFFLICGVAVGLMNPTRWMVSGLTGWGGILVGGFITFNALRRYGTEIFGADEPPYILAGLAILILPVTFSLFGGYLGKQIRLMRTKPLSFS